MDTDPCLFWAEKTANLDVHGCLPPVPIPTRAFFVETGGTEITMYRAPRDSNSAVTDGGRICVGTPFKDAITFGFDEPLPDGWTYRFEDATYAGDYGWDDFSNLERNFTCGCNWGDATSPPRTTGPAAGFRAGSVVHGHYHPSHVPTGYTHMTYPINAKRQLTVRDENGEVKFRTEFEYFFVDGSGSGTCYRCCQS